MDIFYAGWDTNARFETTINGGTVNFYMVSRAEGLCIDLTNIVQRMINIEQRLVELDADI